MIQGRTPEITIKFSSMPDLPTEGKKVTLEILSENGIRVQAELNRKTLKKQVSKMEEYKNWVGAMSGKIKSISAAGIVELESAGIQVFEKKTTDTDAKSDRSSDTKGVKSSSASNPDNLQNQPLNQTLDPEQLEQETKIQNLIATATSPRDKVFYQGLLQKARVERANSQLKSSPSVNSSDPKRAKSKEKTESNTEKKPTSQVIFQGIGVIEGVVESRDNQLKVSIGEYSYELKFVPGYKKKQFQLLKQEIEEKGSCSKTLIVYPQSKIDKKGEIKIAFALSNVNSSESGNSFDLMVGEFKLCGLWQYPPLGSTPCITIRRNWEQGFVNYLEKMDSKQRAYILRPNHLPVYWSNPTTEAFRYPEASSAQDQKPDFVSVKAVFEPKVNKFKVVEPIAEPSQDIPKYLKA